MHVIENLFLQGGDISVGQWLKVGNKGPPFLELHIKHEHWFLSLCSSFPLLLGALFNKACQGFII